MIDAFKRLPVQTPDSVAFKMPLYATEEQIAEEILGPGALREWKRAALELEALGMPKVDPVLGRRYFPAVKAFFDRRHGLHPQNNAASAVAQEKAHPTNASPPRRPRRARAKMQQATEFPTLGSSVARSEASL
jgi:hypothetical protein